jgi:hypothetical protein
VPSACHLAKTTTTTISHELEVQEADSATRMAFGKVNPLKPTLVFIINTYENQSVPQREHHTSP